MTTKEIYIRWQLAKKAGRVKEAANMKALYRLYVISAVMVHPSSYYDERLKAYPTIHLN